MIEAGGTFSVAESTLFAAVEWLRLCIETLGALVVGIGFLRGAWMFARATAAGDSSENDGVRLILARYLALALEFQLAADILSTAVAPTWPSISRLAAIAVIRTGLNYFLQREMEDFAAARARHAEESAAA